MRARLSNATISGAMVDVARTIRTISIVADTVGAVEAVDTVGIFCVDGHDGQDL